MSPHDKRLRRLEFARLVTMAEEMGAEVGISGAEVLAQMRDYLRKSQAEREVQMAHFWTSLTDAEREQAAELEAKYARILGSGSTPPGRHSR